MRTNDFNNTMPALRRKATPNPMVLQGAAIAATSSARYDLLRVMSGRERRFRMDWSDSREAVGASGPERIDGANCRLSHAP